jgi:cysteinyl-tRNA synthetase
MPFETLVDSHLFLHNTMTRRKELFRPAEQGRVLMFTCGPSVYRRQHLGNYRTYLYQDLLQRYLEYRGDKVERLLSLTDVEDKSIAQASESGVDLDELCARNEEQFLSELRMLRIAIPGEIPRSSTTVDQAVGLISGLLENGAAYRHGEDIYFDALRYEGFGRLAGLDLSGWPVPSPRFDRDTYPGQRWNLGDFILWHGHVGDDGDAVWDTPLGRGRPSWNIQDAAMIATRLGKRVDLHCGGMDNLYRHHDYTLAVMETLWGAEYARCWLHGHYLLVDGVKMSKSLGNITSPDDVIGRGIGSDHLRFFLTSHHYREPLDMTGRGLDQAARRLDELREMIRAVLVPDGDLVAGHSDWTVLSKAMTAGFEKAMNDDLDASRAIDAVRDGVGRLLAHKSLHGLSNRESAALRNGLERIDGVLQCLWSEPA